VSVLFSQILLYITVAISVGCHIKPHVFLLSTPWFKKNAPTLADYNYDPVQSILIIFSKLFVNDHKSCLVVKFSTARMLPLYLVKHNALFCTNYTAYRKKCANFGSPYNFNKR